MYKLKFISNFPASIILRAMLLNLTGLTCGHILQHWKNRLFFFLFSFPFAKKFFNIFS